MYLQTPEYSSQDPHEFQHTWSGDVALARLLSISHGTSIGQPGAIWTEGKIGGIEIPTHTMYKWEMEMI